jgi:hypothetical protein
VTIGAWVSLGLVLIVAGVAAALAGCRRGKSHLLAVGLLLALLGWICLWIAHAASAAV